jgi:putative membrane protein
MSDSPYSEFSKEDLILRDHLAADRTVLANERTFLAYIRTALTLFISGASFIRFFDSFLLEVVGWIFVPVGLLTFLVGAVRYRRMKNMLFRLKK